MVDSCRRKSVASCKESVTGALRFGGALEAFLGGTRGAELNASVVYGAGAVAATQQGGVNYVALVLA